MKRTISRIYYIVIILIRIHFSNSLDNTLDNFMSKKLETIASFKNNNVKDDVAITVYVLDDHHNKNQDIKSHIYNNILQGNNGNSSVINDSPKTAAETYLLCQQDLCPMNVFDKGDEKRRQMDKTNKPHKFDKDSILDQQERERQRREAEMQRKEALEKEKREKERKKVEKMQKEQKERVAEIMKFLKPNMISTNYIYEEILRIERTHEIRDDVRKMVWILEQPVYKKYPLARNVMRCYHTNIKSVHDALDLWNHATNRLTFWPVRAHHLFKDIDFFK